MLICELQERYPLNGAEQLINCCANFLDSRFKDLHLIEYKKFDEIKEALLTQEKEKKKKKKLQSVKWTIKVIEIIKLITMNCFEKD